MKACRLPWGTTGVQCHVFVIVQVCVCGGGGNFVVRMECMSHCSGFPRLPPLARSSLPMLTAFTCSHSRI